jgi:hypothetical protein
MNNNICIYTIPKCINNLSCEQFPNILSCPRYKELLKEKRKEIASRDGQIKI